MKSTTLLTALAIVSMTMTANAKDEPGTQNQPTSAEEYTLKSQIDTLKAEKDTLKAEIIVLKRKIFDQELRTICNARQFVKEWEENSKKDPTLHAFNQTCEVLGCGYEPYACKPFASSGTDKEINTEAVKTKI